MKEDILNRSVSDIRLRSLQKCVNKTDSLIFNRDNSIVHIKKTNSTSPFNNTNLGVNFSCNKYGNLETYVDNSGTSVVVSANDIKGSNKEIKKVCNNIYDEIFVDNRTHTNDRRGVRFGSVDCVNINSNNIYSNTRKNVTFNTKIYDDQDYFVHYLDANTMLVDTSNFSISVKELIDGFNGNDPNCHIFKDKDPITDYLYNKNKDHFFAGTEIDTDDTTIKTLMRCNPYKINITENSSSSSFQIYEKNTTLKFGYAGDGNTQIPSGNRHIFYGVYCVIFNAHGYNPGYATAHISITESHSSRSNSYPNASRGEHNDGAHRCILNRNFLKDTILFSYEQSNISEFIKNYVIHKYDDKPNKIFFGLQSSKRINNIVDNVNYISNNIDSSYVIFAKNIQYEETKHVKCGWWESETGRDFHNGNSNAYYSYVDHNEGRYETRDKYYLTFPYGFYELNQIKTSDTINVIMNYITTNNIDKLVSKLKKLNAMNYLNIDDENLNSNVHFTNSINVPDATVDGHTYKIEPSISVLD